MTSEKRLCQNCKVEFTIEPDDFSFYEKIKVPPPTFCSQCRLQRRMLFRNERNFYKRKCDLCSKDIIAVYPSGTSFPVYCVKCWWSDKWNAHDYGREFDFSKSFFEQYKDLLWSTPALSIMNDDGVASTNCEYSYDWFYSKNCYLVVCGWHTENTLYSYVAAHSKDFADSFFTYNCQLIYESLVTFDCYNCQYCTLCFGCQNCFLSFDLKGCSDCVLSVGLRNKQYYIFNQPYKKEEYYKKIEDLQLGSRKSIQKLQAEFQEFKNRFPRKYAYNTHSVGAIGDMIVNSKNAKNCFYTNGIENSRFAILIDQAKDIYDCNNTGKPELCYECVTPDESFMNIATVFCFRSRDVQYSQYCPSSESCFGCVGLKKGSYSILNKKYSKEEYEKLKGKIIEHIKKTGEWGEFFPHWVSPFAYNETAAQEWFPLTKSEVERTGLRWQDEEARDYQITLNAEQLPDTIDSVGDDIVKEVIGCSHEGKCNEKCTTAYRIIPQELQLYRRMNVPLPTLCPNCRHYTRLQKRNPVRLFRRKCQCLSAEALAKADAYKNTINHFHDVTPCPNEFETSYAPDRSDIIYCEDCYNAEIA